MKLWHETFSRLKYWWAVIKYSYNIKYYMLGNLPTVQHFDCLMCQMRAAIKENIWNYPTIVLHGQLVSSFAGWKVHCLKIKWCSWHSVPGLWLAGWVSSVLMMSCESWANSWIPAHVLLVLDLWYLEEIWRPVHPSSGVTMRRSCRSASLHAASLLE